MYTVADYRSSTVRLQLKTLPPFLAGKALRLVATSPTCYHCCCYFLFRKIQARLLLPNFYLHVCYFHYWSERYVMVLFLKIRTDESGWSVLKKKHDSILKTAMKTIWPIFLKKERLFLRQLSNPLPFDEVLYCWGPAVLKWQSSPYLVVYWHWSTGLGAYL